MQFIYFFLTLITTFVFCVAAAMHIHIKTKKDTLSLKAGIFLYCACALIGAVIIGKFLPRALVHLLEGIGIMQNFGPGTGAFTGILNFGLSIIMVPIGIIIIKWQPMKW